MATATTSEQVETFKALKPCNLGWTIRQPGDLIPEYETLDPRTLARLIRQQYVERRLVSKAELDKFVEEHKQPENQEPEAEGNTEAPEEKNTPEESKQPQASVAEETIDDLGPAEEEPESKAAKKVVRKRR